MSHKQSQVATLLVEAYRRHAQNPDWYAAQLSVAVAHTKTLKEAVELADAMFEMNPQPPTTTDEHEVTAREELAGQLSELIPQGSGALSLNAAFASIDQRGVQHRGKGDPRGGQFVQKGTSDDAGASSEGFGSEPRAIEGPYSGSQPRAIEEHGTTDDEAPVAGEASTGPPEDPESDEDPEMVPQDGSEVYDGEMTEDDIATVEAIIAHYPHEQQEQARKLTQSRTTQFNVVGQGANSTAILSLEDGTKGVFKDGLGEQPNLRGGVPAGTYWRREIASSLFAHITGFAAHLVPVTVPRKVSPDLKAYVKNEYDEPVLVSRPREEHEFMGSMQSFIDNSQTAYKYSIMKDGNIYGSDEDLAKAAVLDYITGNSDRHENNWMVLDPSLPSYTPPQPQDLLAQPEEDQGEVMELGQVSSNESNVQIEVEKPTHSPDWVGVTGARRGEVPSKLPESKEKLVEIKSEYPVSEQIALPIQQPEGGSSREIDLMEGAEWEGGKDEEPPMAEIVGDAPSNKMALIDNGLAFPTRHVITDHYYNAELIKRAVRKNLPMPDLSGVKDTWPRVEAALRQCGLEAAAINLTKKRFDWATSGEAKTVAELRNPFESQNKAKNLRDHFNYYGLL